MDRFIDFVTKWIKNGSRNLKSNMDRFIDYIPIRNSEGFYVFKIQYGQIYRNVAFAQTVFLINLKSNMDRFIAILFQTLLQMLQI